VLERKELDRLALEGKRETAPKKFFVDRKTRVKGQDEWGREGDKQTREKKGESEGR